MKDEYRKAQVFSAKVAMIGISLWLMIMVGATLNMGAQKPANPLPGRAPMHSHLLAPSAEWNAYYDVAPEDQRTLFWTNKVLLAVAKEHTANLQDLDKRLKAVEVKLNPPADPNAKK